MTTRDYTLPSHLLAPDRRATPLQSATIAPKGAGAAKSDAEHAPTDIEALRARFWRITPVEEYGFEKLCEVCDEVFIVRGDWKARRRRTCSRECQSFLISQAQLARHRHRAERARWDAAGEATE